MWGQSATEDVHICACNTRSMSHDSIFRFKATLGHFSSSHVCAKLWSFSLRLKLNVMILFISNFNWIHGVGWACCPKGPWKFRHCIHSTHPSWIWHFGTVSPFYGNSRCTTRAKNDGLGNARRVPRCAGTATYFDSYQVLYMKQMVDAT